MAGRSVASVVLTVLIAGVCPATALASLEDAFDAIVKIHVDEPDGSFVGTGSCFEVVAGKVRILTNAHVVHGDVGKELEVSFYANETESQRVRGVVTLRSLLEPPERGELRCRDVAVVECDLADLRIQPSLVALGEDRDSPVVNQDIFILGCPHGEWPTLFKAHVTFTNGVNFKFTPAGKKGRSGSPIMNSDGVVVGLMAWIMPNGDGGAMTIQEVRDAIEIGGLDTGAYRGYNLRFRGVYGGQSQLRLWRELPVLPRLSLPGVAMYDRELYCCEGCGRDTYNLSMLCSACDGDHDEPIPDPYDEELHVYEPARW